MLARVLFALIQCAAMATEVVEVATESEEDIVINCVAIFYEEGKDGENFSKKTKFCCKVNKNEKRTFLIGARTRYGRAVRFNNWLLH